MSELEQLLRDEKLKKDLKTVLERAVNEWEVNQCFWAIRNLESQANNLNPQVRKVFDDEFKTIFLKLKWVALARLTEKEILDLLEHHLLITTTFNEELFNLTQIIRTYILGVFDYDERDNFKLKVREALLANQEIINPQAPIKTIAQWLKNIIGNVGLQLTDRVKESEYYLRDVNFNRLNKEEQNFLKGVISLYKYCLYSSNTPEGVDEPIFVVEDGRLKVLEHGQISTISYNLDPLSEQVIGEFIKATTPAPVAVKKADYQKLETHYRQILAKLINQDKFKSAKQAAKTAEIVLSDFKSQVTAGDLPAIMAGLEKIIQFKSLNSLLISKDFSGEFDLYLESRLGATVKDLIRKVTPEFLSLFLQFLFISKLKLSSEESAVLALYLANVLAKTGEKQFLPMVYGDVKSGTFKWREVAAENGQLKFK